MQKNLLFLFLLFFGISSAFAQKTISGKVTAKEDGSPLPGVNVLVVGTSKGTVTDVEGNYSVSVDESAKKLKFSFVGFADQEVAIGTASTLNVSMLNDDELLQEVVVTGYGVQQKREITGAISSIKSEDIQNVPLQSLDRALQGRTAGVQVQSANGAPGGGVTVRIRGIGSISAGNQPLYIVDGVQMNTSNNASFANGNPLSFLNPNDIESIEVLKDAAAASIYGAQAANGVVLITTKKGKVSGGKTRFSFNYYRGVTAPIKYLDVLNTQEFIQVRREAVQNANPTASAEAVKQNVLGAMRLSPTLTDAEIANLPTYDWQKEGYKTGSVDNFEFSAEGGSDKTNFYLSGSYNREDANVIAVDFKRYTGRLSVTHKATDRLTIDASLNGSYVSQNGAFGNPNGGSFLGSPTFSSPLILPHNPIYNEDGSYYGLPATGGIAGILNQNVIAVANYNTIFNDTRQAVANLSANYKINDWLSAKAFVGMDYRLIRGQYYADARTADGANVSGRLSEQTNENFNYNANFILNFRKTFSEVHKISGLLGTEYRDDTEQGNSMTAQGFPTPQFRTINAAATPLSTGGFWTGFRRSSFFGKIGYDFDGRYVVSFTGRYDGSSRFGANNRFGFFPAVGAAWNVNEEAFLKENKYISSLKLRASYGVTGRDDIGNFPSLGLYGASGYLGLGGIQTSSLENPDLKWERNVAANFGIDFGFFDDRIAGSFEIYRNDSEDLLLNRAVPATSGYLSYTQNVGKVRNEGMEFEVSTVNVDMGGFKWVTNFNVAFVGNKVLQLVGADTVLPGNNSIRVGHPIGAIFDAQYAGVNPATGRPMWYDNNNNPTYVVRNPTDLRVLGKNFADTYGGLTNTFSYKGLELSVFFQYEFGRLDYNNQNRFMMENGGRLFNSLQQYYDQRWQKPGDMTSVPRPFDGNAETRGSGNITGRGIQDGSYIRLKQLTFAYNVPNNLTEKFKINNVKFYAQAYNLYTWTKWEGFDPEFVSLGGAGNNGVIPQPRKVTVGIQFGF